MRFFAVLLLLVVSWSANANNEDETFKRVLERNGLEWVLQNSADYINKTLPNRQENLTGMKAAAFGNEFNIFWVMDKDKDAYQQNNPSYWEYLTEMFIAGVCRDQTFVILMRDYGAVYSNTFFSHKKEYLKKMTFTWEDCSEKT